MGKNNAHLGESKEQRLRRFQDSPPFEIISTLINSIHNFFNNEIAATFADAANPQTSLMLLGVHSVALTVSYGLFNQLGPKGYKLFLEHFVDGKTPDTKFSLVASEIHEWRNVLAHRWLNLAGHDFGYDFEMPLGWRREDDMIFINPKIYLACYLAAFKAGGKIYDIEAILTDDEKLNSAKQRLLSKYIDGA
jgi:hypothetical protein